MTQTAGLADLIGPGERVAFADGIGAPTSLSAELSELARERGDLRLQLGWMPVSDPGLDYSAFADVTTFMPGWGVRGAMSDRLVRGLIVRLSAVPALVHGPLRPDVLVVSLVPRPDGRLAFGTEVSWMQSAIDAGARVVAVLAHGTPDCSAGPGLDPDDVTVVGQTQDAPAPLSFTAPEDVHHAIATNVARWVPEGCRIQFGPGALGTALLAAIDTPVHVDSGILADGVVDLDRRGLLLGRPVATYLAGGEELLQWCAGRGVLHPLEFSHDLTRLSTGVPLISINTAIELDEQAQVNVEGRIDAPVAGPGGHPDYSAAAVRSIGGLSIIAMPSTHRGRSTLVDSLSAPVSTVGHDVDIVVNEHGSADLRGLDRRQRAAAVRKLWP